MINDTIYTNSINNIQDCIDEKALNKLNFILKTSDLVFMTDSDLNVWEIVRRVDLVAEDLHNVNKLISVKKLYQHDLLNDIEGSSQDIDVSRITELTIGAFKRSYISELSGSVYD